MFTMKKNEVIRVHSARTGHQKDGTPYAMIKWLESENQPKGLEKPSQSKTPCYIWMQEFPKELEGIKDGCLIKLVDFDGFEMYRESYERFGKMEYRPALRILGAKVELA